MCFNEHYLRMKYNFHDRHVNIIMFVSLLLDQQIIIDKIDEKPK